MFSSSSTTVASKDNLPGPTCSPSPAEPDPCLQDPGRPRDPADPHSHVASQPDSAYPPPPPPDSPEWDDEEEPSEQEKALTAADMQRIQRLAWWGLGVATAINMVFFACLGFGLAWYFGVWSREDLHRYTRRNHPADIAQGSLHDPEGRAVIVKFFTDLTTTADGRSDGTSPSQEDRDEDEDDEDEEEQLTAVGHFFDQVSGMIVDGTKWMATVHGNSGVVLSDDEPTAQQHASQTTPHSR
eukprot:gene4737-862_t